MARGPGLWGVGGLQAESIVPLVKTAVFLLKRNPEARWVLSFARRNVPVELVLQCAEENG